MSSALIIICRPHCIADGGIADAENDSRSLLSQRTKQHLSHLGSNQVARVYTAARVTTRSICFEIKRAKKKLENFFFINYNLKRKRFLFFNSSNCKWCAHSGWRIDRSTLNAVFLKCTEGIDIDTNHVIKQLRQQQQQQRNQRKQLTTWLSRDSVRADSTTRHLISRHSIYMSYICSTQEFRINCTTPNWVDDE